MRLAYCTGLRISELAAARYGDIHLSHEGVQCWLKVPLGKGGKPRVVPLNPGLAGQLKAYAEERGLDWALLDPTTPIIGRLDRRANPTDKATVEKPLTPDGLYPAMKGLFEETADAREAHADGNKEQDSHDIQALRRLTPHSLRHTNASHAVNHFGVKLVNVKEDLGHASLGTTSQYVHADQDLRYSEMAGMYQAKRKTPDGG